MRFYSLLDVLRAERDTEATLFITDEGEISWQKFLADVALMSGQLTRRSERCWALYCDETYVFAVGFFALLSANKTIVLPPNAQPGTLRELSAHYDALLSDLDEIEGLRQMSVSFAHPDNRSTAPLDFSDDAVITLFTSGSTGEPKKIEKHLHHLACEIDVLEASFGARMGEATVYATVSHQHIYGLLFKLLWPMCAGRVIRTHFYDYPELLLKEITERNPAVLVSSPAQLARMPHLVDIGTMQPHLVLTFSSGGPLSEEAALIWADQLGQAPVEVLGSTETGGVAYRQRHHGEAWQAFDRVQISRLGSEGLLHVDSPYLPDADGFTLGDRIELLDERQFLLLGRADRIVKVEEKRVSLDEMERRLMQSKWVKQALVCKIQGQRRDMLAAVIVPTTDGWHQWQQGKREMNNMLKDELLNHFERVVLPRKWRYVETLPLNSQGKITAAAVRSMFE